MQMTGSIKRIRKAALELLTEKSLSELNLKELAEAAGVSRATLYNNELDSERLFCLVTDYLTEDMAGRINKINASIRNPAARICVGILMFLKNTHDDPPWGRFMIRYAYYNNVLSELTMDLPKKDVTDSVESGQIKLDGISIDTATIIINSTALASMFQIAIGKKGWREIGLEICTYLLKSFNCTLSIEEINDELPPNIKLIDK